MGIVLVLITLAVGIMWALSANSKEYEAGKRRKSANNPHLKRVNRILDENRPLLLEKLSYYQSQYDKDPHAHGQNDEPLSDYFSPASDTQKNVLNIMDVHYEGDPLVSGVADDIINMFEPLLDNEQKVILKFFKHKLTGMNAFKGEWLVYSLRLNSESRKEWEDRPASPIQREFYIFIGQEPPKDLPTCKALAFNDNYYKQSTDEDLLDDWSEMEAIYDVVTEPDDCRAYGIKKVRMGMFKEVVNRLKTDGTPIRKQNPDMFVEKLKRMYPDIERED